MDCGKPDDEGDGGRGAHVPGLPAPENQRLHRGGERPAAGLGERGAQGEAGLYHGQSTVCWCQIDE